MSEGLVISRVEKATDTVTRDIAVETVLKSIRTGGKKLRAQIEQIRNRFEAELDITGDLKAAKRAIYPLKKKLPGVMWSGQYSSREEPVPDKLQKHSGLLIGDSDDLGEQLLLTRKKLEASPHVFALFLSPNGNGLKVVFRVRANASKHAANFRAVEKHVLELTGIQIDESGKDIGRLCFMSYDPQLYHNPDAIELEPLPEPEKPKPATFNPSGEVNLSVRQRIATEMFGDIEWDSDTHGFLTCPGKHLHTTGENEQDCEIHLDGVPNIHCFHGHCKGIEAGVNHELQSRIGKAEFVPTPSTKAETRDGEPVELPPPPPPYDPPPLGLLPSKLQDYVQAAAESLNVDVSFVLLPKLSALGSAIGNARSIFLKRGFVQPPVIWTGTVGRSGSRKSPGQAEGCFAVMEHELELARQNKQAMEKYENDLAEWESKPKKERGAKPEPPLSLTSLMDDMTLSALADAMQENPRGVLVKKDELSHWFASFDQYHASKGADVSRWLSLHTGVFFGLDRRTDKRRYRIHQPRVCVTGGIQPKVLARVLTEDFFERGLPARFLFADPPGRRDKWSEATVPADLSDDVLKLFEQLWLLQPDHDDHNQSCPKLLHLDPDAKAEFVRYYNECGAASVEAEEHEEAAWCKLSGYAARLALVGQIARDPNTEIVTGDTMKAACDLARWFGAEAIRIYAALSETPEQRNLRRLIEFIQSRGGKVTLREITQSFRPLRNNRDEAERQLNALVRAGLGVWKEIKGTRGPATREFWLLQVSTSTGFSISPSIGPKPVDVDTLSSQKITSSGKPEPAPEKEPSPATVSLPVMITKKMEADLATMGYSHADIDKMTRGQANDILAGKPVGVPGDGRLVV